MIIEALNAKCTDGSHFENQVSFAKAACSEAISSGKFGSIEMLAAAVFVSNNGYGVVPAAVYTAFLDAIKTYRERYVNGIMGKLIQKLDKAV